MAQFASAHHLASWIGVCPGQNESAGVSRSGRTRPGNSNLKRLLGIAAMVALKSKDSYLGVFFRRLAARRGGKRALVAVMHKSSPSGMSCMTKPSTASSDPTTSPGGIPNAPCAAYSRKPTA
ncbi:transposase [Streptomyces sp. NPDC056390]|uniref:transposase n=1 Tax=Streptomyces sp. NPDC056390 TaxID=3345806 RepID=UPI0035D80E34